MACRCRAGHLFSQVFRWRQPWESSEGQLVSVLPNKVYITGDGCGPDDKICCQFEWGPSNMYRCNAPKRIVSGNVKHYGDLLAAQYRKLASLFRSKAGSIEMRTVWGSTVRGSFGGPPGGAGRGLSVP